MRQRSRRRAAETKATLRVGGRRESSPDTELSAAVVAYLGRGSKASPLADVEACRAATSGTDPDVLVDAVIALVGESLAIAIDWDEVDLSSAGAVVASTMRDRHPGLTAEALDALAWNATFAWR